MEIGTAFRLRVRTNATLAVLATVCAVGGTGVLGACSDTQTIIYVKKDSGAKPVVDAGEEEDAAAEDASTVDAAVVDAGSDAAPSKAAACANQFGTALTNDFGRFDGTVVAIVQPKDQQCYLPNSDHVILQVKGNGSVYRMVVNIQSDFGPDFRVRYTKLDHALVGGPWSEGWHTPVKLDYVSDLGVHKNANGFTPYTLADLSVRVTDDIDIGDKVSVFADSSGGSSAHKIHRNLGFDDGAIVLHANSANPKYLLFHFDTQNF